MHNDDINNWFCQEIPPAVEEPSAVEAVISPVKSVDAKSKSHYLQLANLRVKRMMMGLLSDEPNDAGEKLNLNEEVIVSNKVFF